MLTHYHVKETVLRFASFEADTEAVTCFSGEWSFGRHRSHAFGKTNQAPMLRCEISFFDTSFEASVLNITKMHNQPREPQPYENCRAKSIQEFGSRHQEPPHTDMSRNLATVVIRGVLPGLRRRRTGLLPSGPKSSFQMRAILYLIWKPRS